MMDNEKDFVKVNINKMRWRFGACPRCKGALYSNYGEEFACFNCGYIEYKFIDYKLNLKGGYNG